MARSLNMSALLRRLSAMLLAVVVAISSLGGVARQAPAGPAHGQTSLAGFVKLRTTTIKPCQKAVLPGAATTCLLANMNAGSPPASDTGHGAPERAVIALRWYPMDSRLAAQCGASSPYRPPCTLG